MENGRQVGMVLGWGCRWDGIEVGMGMVFGLRWRWKWDLGGGDDDDEMGMEWE